MLTYNVLPIRFSLFGRYTKVKIVKHIFFITGMKYNFLHDSVCNTNLHLCLYAWRSV